MNTSILKSLSKRQEGFTWQEAVIAFALFGLVMLIAGVLLHNSREENRDLKRLSDVKAIQHALELYFFDCNQYPLSIRPGGVISGAEQCQGNEYLSYVPADPKGFAYDYLPCKDETNKECSQDIDNPKSYRIIYNLESNTESLRKGPHMAVPENFAAK